MGFPLFDQGRGLNGNDDGRRMSKQDLRHLFIPGDGGLPPYLAGRKREQEYFRDCVEALKDRKPISQNMIIYGPRGNGKTALLRHLQNETLKKEGEKLDIQWITPGRMETPAEFENTLTGKKRFKDKFRKLVASVAYLSASAGIELDLSGSASTVEDQIRKKCKKKPFILIIDEAHRLKPQIAESLLNTSQELRSEGHPFLLILAGTPNLRAELRKANASFWDRSRILPLGRLSPEEARQAITIPLQGVGISFTPGIVEEVVGRTHCYPFFTQVWGDCLARRLDQTGKTEITMDTVNESEEEALRSRNEMYRTRYQEFESQDLLPVAEEIARVFTENPEKKIGKREISLLIGKALQDNDPSSIPGSVIMQTIDTLAGLGYIWETDSMESTDYEPGIPSLMSYVNARAPAHSVKTTPSLNEPVLQ